MSSRRGFKRERERGVELAGNATVADVYIFLRKYAKSMQKVCSAKTLLCLALSTYFVSHFKPNQNR